VDIELPSLEDTPVSRLVDTPGWAVFLNITNPLLKTGCPRSATALLAISFRSPLSENDLGLIRELTRHTPNIILLLTKADFAYGRAASGSHPVL